MNGFGTLQLEREAMDQRGAVADEPGRALVSKKRRVIEWPYRTSLPSCGLPIPARRGGRFSKAGGLTP